MRAPTTWYGWAGWILSFALAIAIGIMLGMAPTSTTTTTTPSGNYGVDQVQGQEWPPFYASELRAARAHMRDHPVKLRPGEVQVAVIRTIVSAGDGTASCAAWGDCWKALVLYSSDREPLTYHIINAYGSQLSLFQYCVRRGDFFVLNLAKMQSLGSMGDPTNVPSSNLIRTADGGPLACNFPSGSG